MFIIYYAIGPEKTSKLSFNANNEYTITGLKPNTKYLLNVAYHTAIGRTHFTADVDPVLTKPCSPPANVRAPSTTKSSATITWDVPLSIGKGVKIDHYRYVLKKGKLCQIILLSKPVK